MWRAGGKRRLTVVVKASFVMVPGGAMQLVAPLDVSVGDRHADDLPDRSLVSAGELAPYLPRAEVSFVGHAYAPKPIPEMSVRLAVVGNRQLVDKTLYVYGERMLLDDGQVTQPVPFTRIPLRYERASRGLAGYEENPSGMAYAAGQPVPNIIDPSDPEAPAGFGPIPSSWPSRLRLLRGLEPSLVEGAEPELPDAFAWSYFHAAPTDQRCSFFEGREWVVLDGLNAQHPHLESHLPGARAQARLYDVDSTGHTELTLNADTMWIDGDRGIVCVLWRGNHEVGSDAELARSQIFAGLELPGRPIPWPGERARRASSMPARAMPEHAAPEHTPVPMSPAPYSPSPAPHPPSPALHSPAPHSPPVHAHEARSPSGPELHAHSSAPHANASSMPPAPPEYGHAHPGSSPPPATVGMPTARLGHEHVQTYPGAPGVPAHGASGSGSSWPAVAPRPASEAPAASTTHVLPQAAVASPPLPLSPQLTPSPIDVRGAMDPAFASPQAPIAQPGPAPVGRGRLGNTLASSDPATAQLAAKIRATVEYVSDARPSSTPESSSSFGYIEPMDRESVTAIRVHPQPTNGGVDPSDGNHGARPPAFAAYPAPGLPPLEPPVSSSMPLVRGLGDNTISAPASEIARLLHAAAGASSQAGHVFDEPSTRTVDVPPMNAPADESSSPATVAAKPVRAEPQAPPPPRPLDARPMKTTIRGLQASSKPPTTTRAPTAEIPLGARLEPLEQPVSLEDSTRQLSVPAELLRLAAERAASAQAARPDDDGGSTRIASVPAELVAALSQAAPPAIVRAPLPSTPDFGDEGPPTMAHRGRPAVISASDMREEVERRVREGEGLEGLDLSDTDLSGFDLSGRKLGGARFDRANLSGCGLRGVDLSGVSLEGANLRGAQLDDAMLERTNLVGADLSGASLVRCFLTDANLSTAIANEASFDQASGQRTIFARMRAEGARFTSASLDGADFTEAHLDAANFDSALLPEARLYEASAEEASFLRATLVGARLDGAVLSRSRFDGATADDSLWDRSVLDGSSLVGAQLVGASFIKASLREADLSRANVTDARFNRATLTRARVVGTDLTLATLDGAELSGMVTGEA